MTPEGAALAAIDNYARKGDARYAMSLFRLLDSTGRNRRPDARTTQED